MIRTSCSPQSTPNKAISWMHLVKPLLLSTIAWVGFSDLSHATSHAATTPTNATLIVRTLEDGPVTPGDPICEATCTLRDAIRVANATEGPDIIEFAPGLSGEIVLHNVLTINDDLTLIGPVQEIINISVPGNDAMNRRAFFISNSTTVLLRDLTV